MSRTHIIVDPAQDVAPVHRRTFGSFVEHLGRCVYTGIYEPTHETANDEGFRGDVIGLVKELGISTIRYPGGNFVSDYRWQDGVGPREDRPKRLDFAWHSVETNAVGVDEFARWCASVDAELMMAVNLGTAGVKEAIDLLEYTNHPSGSTLSDRRIANGSPEPYGVRMWCLGNEMDGPWQTGHLSASDYGQLAERVASAMKKYDSGLEMVACGSSYLEMPTFGDWEREVLRHCYDQVEYLACHAFYWEKDGDLGSFLGSSQHMQTFIDGLISAADSVGRQRGSSKKIMLSFDEWNVNYRDTHKEQAKTQEWWQEAPRLLEDLYSVADGVVVADLLMTLLSNSDRVGAASLAQLVNAIAPIMTEPDGPSWRQTTFFPFSVMSRLSKGRVLRPHVVTERYATKDYGEIDVVTSVATFDSDLGETSIFLANRDQAHEVEVTIDVSRLPASVVRERLTLHDDDPYARNTLEQPERVGLRENESVELNNGVLRLTLPPVSWTAISLA